MNKVKYIDYTVSDVKVKSDGEFTCYANVKNIVDYARDMTVNGAFVDSVNEHKNSKTMPQMFWMHKSYDLPVGVWIDMEEDNHGLKMKGRLSETSLGKDIKVLAKDGALKEFSIGYIVEDENWNGEYNELRKVNITEVSWVTRACNDQSVLLDIKSRMDDGELPTKRELEKLLREECGMSRKQSGLIANNYSPDQNQSEDLNEIKNMLASIGK